MTLENLETETRTTSFRARQDFQVTRVTGCYTRPRSPASVSPLGGPFLSLRDSLCTVPALASGSGFALAVRSSPRRQAPISRPFGLASPRQFSLCSPTPHEFDLRSAGAKVTTREGTRPRWGFSCEL